MIAVGGSTAKGFEAVRDAFAEAQAADEGGDMVRKSPQQEDDEYVDRLAAVTDWLGIRVEQYPAWTVAALERELALMNRLAKTVTLARNASGGMGANMKSTAPWT